MGLLRASRVRSRNGGDSRLRAGCPQIGCARFVALEPRNEPLARRSQHGGQPGTSALPALGILGEAAGHARAKANTRRIACGEGRRQAGPVLANRGKSCFQQETPRRKPPLGSEDC